MDDAEYADILLLFLLANGECCPVTLHPICVIQSSFLVGRRGQLLSIFVAGANQAGVFGQEFWARGSDVNKLSVVTFLHFQGGRGL